MAVAPVRQWRIHVDADEVDVPVRPERIEVEGEGAAAHVVTAIFGPVGGVGNLRVRPENGAHIARKRPQRLNGGIVSFRVVRLRQALEFGADQEGVDAARRRAELRIVQHHAPV